MFDLSENEIINNFKTLDIKVSIICCTYNQEKYLSQALEGFLKQKTDFAFEVLVNDDASTDNTAKIIKEYETKYPKIIKGIYHKINEYSQGINVFGNTSKLAKGKYIAICEGDDYWIDDSKLQIQYNFLEKNSCYNMCYSKAKVFFQNKNQLSDVIIGSDYISYEYLFVKGNDIPTLTTFLKKDLLYKYLEDIKPSENNWLMGDLPMWLWFAKNGIIGFIPKITSVYRVLENSASHFDDEEKMEKFWQSAYDIRKFFAQKYNDNDLLLQYSYLSKYNKAAKNKDIVSLKMNYKKISKKYIRNSQHLKNKLKCNKLIYNIYQIIFKKNKDE